MNQVNTTGTQKTIVQIGNQYVKAYSVGMENNTSLAVNELKLDAIQNMEREYPFFSRQKTHDIFAIALKYRAMESALQLIGQRDAGIQGHIAREALALDPLA